MDNLPIGRGVCPQDCVTRRNRSRFKIGSFDSLIIWSLWKWFGYQSIDYSYLVEAILSVCLIPTTGALVKIKAMWVVVQFMSTLYVSTFLLTKYSCGQYFVSNHIGSRASHYRSKTNAQLYVWTFGRELIDIFINVGERKFYKKNTMSLSQCANNGKLILIQDPHTIIFIRGGGGKKVPCEKEEGLTFEMQLFENEPTKFSLGSGHCFWCFDHKHQAWRS